MAFGFSSLIPLAGGLLGGALGGLSGGYKAPALQSPTPVTKFTSPLGTATRTGFTYTPAAGTAGITSTARTNLADLLNKGLTIDPQQQQAYTNAYLNARLPALQQELQRQGSQAAASNAAQGLAGSSSAEYAKALQNLFANQQVGALRNQAILGGQQLAQQDLASRINALNAYQGISQQDIANMLAAQGATTGARVQSQQADLNLTDALNKMHQQQAADQYQQSQSGLSNIMGGLQAGVNLASAFAPMF